MLKVYIKAREAMTRLLTDRDGMVSIEYVIVAACVVFVVVVAFGKNGPLETALTNGLSSIGSAITSAVANG
jgi:Flp pilus assembly pilin Flp